MHHLHRYTKKTTALAAGLVAGLFMLAGCGQQAGGSGDTSPAETPSAASAESTTTVAPTSISLSPKTEGKDMKEESYADLSNEALSWWYRIPEPLGEAVPATIEAPIANLLDKYEGMWQAPAGKKKVYITMDAGYELEGSAPSLLATAKEKDFKINFFLTKGYVESNPELVKQMKADGHVICNHSNMHLNGPEVLAESGLAGLLDEIEPMNESLRNVIGEDAAPFFRPPQGGYSERSLAIIRDLGYHPVFWSFAYRDWVAEEQFDHDDAINKIMEQLHDGSILLLHANSQTNVDIMGRLVDKIREQGYEIGTLYEAYDLIKEAAENPTPTESGEATAATPASPAGKEQPANSVPYVVKQGETLWGIVSNYYSTSAQEVGQKIKDVAALNGYDDPEEMPLRAGETIYLPEK